MSVVINGMEMPISCPHCPCSDDESRFCRAANKYIPMLGKPKFCPLATIEERKKGKIIIRSNMLDGEECYCSECDHWGLMPDYEFCPYCGADMRGEQND